LQHNLPSISLSGARTAAALGSLSFRKEWRRTPPATSYVVDYDESRIQKFTGTGTYLTQWGTVGSGNGEFRFPIGVFRFWTTPSSRGTRFRGVSMKLFVSGKRSTVQIAAGVLISVFLLAMQLPAASTAGTRPTVQFIVAPAPGDTVHYGVPFSWQGSDLDGTVLLYRIAIDPPAFGDPVWIETSSTAQTLFFQTSSLDLPIPASGPITFSQPHSVVLKAVDNEGLESDPVSRSFFTSNIAPEVQIVSPTPSPTTYVPIGRNVTIRWQGTDSDGVFINRPVKYKFRVFTAHNIDHPEISNYIAFTLRDPDAMRVHYAPDFSNWDPTSGDTTSVHFTNLNPGQLYLFCVVGFDEVGAYSARFGPASNMIQLLVDLVTFDFTPNKLDLASQGLWVTGFLEPGLPFAASDIDVSSIRLNGTVPVDPAAPTALGDHDGNGVPDLMVKFNRAAVELTVSEGDNVPVTVAGTVDGRSFSGTDYIGVRRAVVSAPAAGSHLMAGSVTEVRWQVPSDILVQSVALLQSLDGGSTWSLLAPGQPNTGSYDWTVPNVQTDQAKVAVEMVAPTEEAGYIVEGVLGVSEAFAIDGLVSVGDGGPAQFALRGVAPNPAQHELQVRFSLKDSNAATLALFDVSGRQVDSRRVDSMGPGWHSVTLGTRGSLPAGLYIIRLTQDGRSLTTRAALVR